MDKVFKYGFVILTVLLAATYFIMDRQKNSLKERIREIQKQSLKNKLTNIEQRVKESELSLTGAIEEYEKLSKRYGDIMDSLGLQHAFSKSKTKP